MSRRLLLPIVGLASVSIGVGLFFLWRDLTPPVPPPVPPPPVVVQRNRLDSVRRAASRADEPQATQPPWTIAFVSDRFTSPQAFTSLRNQFMESLFADPFFQERTALFESTHDLFVPSRAIESGVVESALRLRANNDRYNCYYDRTEAFGTALGKIIEAANIPDLRSIVVLTNQGSSAACAAGDVTIIDNAKLMRYGNQVVPHEFGHVIGGLFDEHGGQSHRTRPVRGPNCTDSPNAPPWDPSLGTPSSGCWQDSQLWKPSTTCRMGSDTSVQGFCLPCTKRLNDVLGAVSVAAVASTYTQVLVQMFPKTSLIGTRVVAKAVAVTQFTGRMPMIASRGPILTTALNSAQKPICVRQAEPDRFEGRAYDPDGGERVGSVDSVFAILYCSGQVTRDDLKRFDHVQNPFMSGTQWLESSMLDKIGDARVLRSYRTVR